MNMQSKRNNWLKKTFLLLAIVLAVIGALFFDSIRYAWLVHHARRCLKAGDHQAAFGYIGRSKDVLKRGEFREQVIELKDHTEMPIPQEVATTTGQIVDTMTVKQDFAGVGLIQRAQ